MILTPEEERMLAGDQGPGVALAMKVLVGIGEAFDAERLTPITRAHVALSNQEADLWFAEKLLAAGARCRISPTVNPGFDLEFFRGEGLVGPEDAALMERTRRTYQALGATLSFSCTPYLLDNIPRQGEIVAFSESSATPYVNSVWGARSHREAAQSALCAAVAGLVPVYGPLEDRNRLGRVVVEVQAELADDYDYSLLGWLVGRQVGPDPPVFLGLPRNPGPEALTNLGAQLNTSGAVPIFHLVGITPEAPTIEAALGGRSPKRTIAITRPAMDLLRNSWFHPPGPVDFVMFGCPHHTLNQVSRAADFLQGRRLKVPLWILTSAHTREMARRMGLLAVIEKAGGRIVADTCIDQPCWRHLAGQVGATDSPKCAYYARRREMSFVVRPIRDCLQAGLTGVMP